jgi:hypothetical protein
MLPEQVSNLAIHVGHLRFDQAVVAEGASLAEQ